MFHHIQLGLVYLLVYFAKCFTPGYHELCQLQSVSLRAEFLELGASRPPEYLVPRLTIVVCPSETLCHSEHFAVHAQHLCIRHWLVGSLELFDRLLEKG